MYLSACLGSLGGVVKCGGGVFFFLGVVCLGVVSPWGGEGGVGRENTALVARLGPSWVPGGWRVLRKRGAGGVTEYPTCLHVQYELQCGLCWHGPVAWS